MDVEDEEGMLPYGGVDKIGTVGSFYVSVAASFRDSSRMNNITLDISLA